MLKKLMLSAVAIFVLSAGVSPVFARCAGKPQSQCLSPCKVARDALGNYKCVEKCAGRPELECFGPCKITRDALGNYSKCVNK